MAQVPSAIQVPSTAPADIQSVAMYLTVMMNQLQNWIALASQTLNSFGGYNFSVDTNGNLIVTSPDGNVTLVALKAPA